MLVGTEVCSGTVVVAGLAGMRVVDVVVVAVTVVVGYQCPLVAS